jgi:hypothetical protein
MDWPGRFDGIQKINSPAMTFIAIFTIVTVLIVWNYARM